MEGELIYMMSLLGAMALFWLFKKWRNRSGNRQKLLGVDAPEVFDRLLLDEDLHFEPDRARVKGQLNGWHYTLFIASREDADLPYAHRFGLEMKGPELLPETVCVKKLPVPGDVRARTSRIRDEAMIEMPRQTYSVPLDELCHMLFGEPGKRLFSCMTQQNLVLHELVIRRHSMRIALDLLDETMLRIKDSEVRQAFIAGVIERLLGAVSEFDETPASTLELYAFILGQLHVSNSDWGGLRDHVFVKHGEDPASRAAWSQIMKQARPDHMGALLLFDVERFCTGLKHFELHDRLAAAFDYDPFTCGEDTIDALLPWLEPSVLYCSWNLPLDFRLSVLRLWLERGTFSQEELAPAIALMRARLSAKERSHMNAFFDESALRGGLSTSGEALQGALTEEK